jgi:hypothetical protein
MYGLKEINKYFFFLSFFFSVSLYSVPCLGDLSLLRGAAEQRAVVGVAAAAHDQAPDPRVGKTRFLK